MFDCDGVLTDSEEVSYLAWSRTLSVHGHDLTRSEFASSIGTTDRGVAETYAARLGVDADVLGEAARSAFLDLVDRVGVFEDAVRLHDRLTVPSAVGTNSARWRLDALLAGTGLSDRFGVTVTASEVDAPKPAPDIYLSAFAALGVDPTRGVVIEDSPSGIAAAVACGAFVVAVDRRHLDRSALDGAHLVVDDLG